MTTGTALTQRARRKIGAFSPIAPSGDDASIIVFAALNSMIQQWLSQNIAIGISPMEDIANDLEEPLDITEVIVDNLAVLIAPNFEGGKPNVSQALQDNARRGYAAMRNSYQTVSIPNKVVSSTLVQGAGNDSFVFAGRGATLDSSNG